MRRPARARFAAFSATCLLLTLILSRLSPAQVPRTLSYQGILTDTTGVPKPNSSYGMTFRLYSVAQGGTPLWTESQVLGTTRGLFNAVLGDISPFPDSLRFDRRYWLGIQVSPDPELTPRIQLSAVGYSLRSRIADTAQYARNVPGTLVADSARVAGTVPNNSISASRIAIGQVVKSLNGVHDVITLRGQGAASITSNGDTITISTPPPSGGTGVQSLQNTNNTLTIVNPTGPTVTANVKVPLALNGNVPLGATLSTVNGATGGVGISSLSDSTHGIYSATNSTAFAASGVLGVANATSGYVVGAYGLANNSPFGTGVTGWGSLQGVYGTSTSGGNGVVGQSSTNGIGVYGSSVTGAGVRGEASQTGPGAYGVYGLSPGIVGVLGEITGTSGQGIGVVGKTAADNGIGVRGVAANSTGLSYGVVGISNSLTNNSAGVRGSGTGSQSIGVEGVSQMGTGIVGRGGLTGGYFESTADKGIVVNGNTFGGQINASTGTGLSVSAPLGSGLTVSALMNGLAVTSTSGITYLPIAAVKAQSDGGDALWGQSNSGYGVFASSTSNDGVHGETKGFYRAGVIGVHPNGSYGILGTIFSSGINYRVGVYGDSGPGDAGYGVMGWAHPGNDNLAGFFAGDVTIDGTFKVNGSKSFCIDHPLDPANRYLIHSSVESNDQMNIYNGNITTDATGTATVELPSYFSALNRDFRYQLTVIGQFAQAIVSSKIAENRFSIKTSKPDVEVSWQVTGIRNDAYARAHPMTVEVDKPAGKKGTYTHPELYGLPRRTFDLRTRTTNPPAAEEKR